MKRLYRSEANRVVGGVCGGLAEYTAVDPTVVRLAWIILACLEGIGILAYIIAWVVIPRRPAGETAEMYGAATGQGTSSLEPAHAGRGARTLGIILVVIGGILLIRNTSPAWLRIGAFSSLWPVALILLGAWLVIEAVRGDR